LALVTIGVGEEGLVQSGAEDLAQLAQVLHAVRPLPLGRLPLRRGDPRQGGYPPPVGLRQLGALVCIRLIDHRAHLPRSRPDSPDDSLLFGVNKEEASVRVANIRKICWPRGGRTDS